MFKKLTAKPVLATLVLGVVSSAVIITWQGGNTGPEADNAETDRRPTHRSLQYDRAEEGDAVRSTSRRDKRVTRHPEDENRDTSGLSTGTVSHKGKPAQVRSPRNADPAILRKGASANSSKHNSNGGLRKGLAGILANRQLSTRQRVEAIQALRSKGALAEDDRAAVLDYLANAAPPEGTSPGQQHWIVDELISTLRADGADNEALSQTLASLYQNTRQHMVVRDYALQHLGHLGREGGDVEVIERTLQAAINEKEGTLAGTALLALNQNKEGNQTGETAVKVASDQATDLRSRITAMQVAGKQGNREALPLATSIAADKNQPVALRMSAIATLADLGAKDQQAMLQKLSKSRDIRLRNSAKAALSKLYKEQ